MEDVNTRQLALEEIALHNGFYESDLTVLGKLLTLKDHPNVKVVRLGSPSTSHSHYEAILEEETDDSVVKEMLIEQGFEFGKYSNGKPFYDLVSEGGNHIFYLRIVQPDR